MNWCHRKVLDIRRSVLTLNRLPPRQRAQLISGVVGGKVLPKEIAHEIIQRTDGIPLFIEELTKAVIESGMVSETGDQYEFAGVLAPLAIPTSLHASLLARLDRLAPVRDVAQIAAALGRRFSHELICAVAPVSKQKLDHALEQLITAQLIFRRGIPPDAEYTFKHALVQDAAYSTLLRSQRQELHARIAAVLELQFSDIAQSRPELLAHHYTEANCTDRALNYWYMAGRQAIAVFALEEAIAHLTKGIALLARLPKNITRIEREIEFQLALAVPVIATHGYGLRAVEICAQRAQELGNRLGNHKSQFAVCRLVWNSSVLRGPLPQAVDLAQELMRLARHENDTARLALAHRSLGFSLAS
jgi:predicted ATPase